MTQERLAERIGKTQGAIGHWLNGRREPGLDDIAAIMRALGLDEITLKSSGGVRDNHMDSETGHENETFVRPSLLKRYPLISWNDVSKWCANKRDDVEVIMWLPSLKDYGDDAFFLGVRDDTMTGSSGTNYPKGSAILTVPYQNQPLEPGDKVVARPIGGTDAEMTFKYYYEDGGKKWLRAAIPGYPYLPGEEYEIVGTVVGAWVN